MGQKKNKEVWDDSSLSMEDKKESTEEKSEESVEETRKPAKVKSKEKKPAKSKEKLKLTKSEEETKSKEDEPKPMMNERGRSMVAEHSPSTKKQWKKKLKGENQKQLNEGVVGVEEKKFQNKAKDIDESPYKKKSINVDEEESREDSSQGSDDGGPPEDFVPVTIELSQKNKEFYNDRKWPDGLLPYIIKVDSTYDLPDIRARLGAVADILRLKTCVRMKEITEEDAKHYEDYLVLDNSPDYVTGRVGGRQLFGVVELLRGGQHKQHTAMMVMAMLGFYFEVARHDRDIYIRVHNRHIRADKLHHFEKIRSDATFDLPYDYKSAMHPAWQFWRHIGKTGISTVATYKERDPDGSVMRSLGQNDNLLSTLDIIKINSVYGIKCFRPKSPLKKKT